jgi:hypothetical protein
MVMKLRKDYVGISPAREPGIYSKEPSNSDLYRALNGARSTPPAGNDRSLKPLDQLREALRARGYSPQAEGTYCQWVKRFISFHNVRHPAEMAEPEITAFLNHLAEKHQVSASMQGQALSALLFLYRHIIGREVGDQGNFARVDALADGRLQWVSLGNMDGKNSETGDEGQSQVHETLLQSAIKKLF